MRNDQDAMQRFWGVLMGTTEDMVDADLQAVFAHLDADPAARRPPMGCIGYCIGARSVVVMMARHAIGSAPASGCTRRSARRTSPTLRTCSSRRSPDRCTSRSAEDKMQSPEDNVPFIDAVNAMDGSGEAVVHDGADHGFAVPGPRVPRGGGDEVVREGARALQGPLTALRTRRCSAELSLKTSCCGRDGSPRHACMAAVRGSSEPSTPWRSWECEPFDRCHRAAVDPPHHAMRWWSATRRHRGRGGAGLTGSRGREAVVSSAPAVPGGVMRCCNGRARP